MSGDRKVVVCGGFDDIRSGTLRFLQEASGLGSLTVVLWPDTMLERLSGAAPILPLAERRYLLEAVRYVDNVVLADAELGPDALPSDCPADIWADVGENARRRDFCVSHGQSYRVIEARELSGFPERRPTAATRRKKAVVTGCYDWFHSGHVRFFEEASAYGDLYVIVGHDANIRLLKGEGHPMMPQEERRYMAGSIRHVARALVSSGDGWLDADPEIRALKPDFYVVNEDGDKGGKREYCREFGIEYVVLSRTPAPGLPRRSSTDLRGF
jgi:cytidyltransferase-like protein